MKIKILIILFFSFYTNLTLSNKIEKIYSRFKFEIPIRVLLSNVPEIESIDWTLQSDEGFVIVLPDLKKRFVINKPNLTIKNLNGQFSINNKKFTYDSFYIVPIKNHLNFNDNYYQGIFAVIKLNGFIYLINHLDIEDYVLTVLPSETWPTWPEEVNYGLSICIRSYALAKILEQKKLLQNRGLSSLYDIKNSNVHMVYKGSNDFERLKETVNKTKGIILSYKNCPVLAMFDISCGSVIPSKMSGLSFSQAPYLFRTYACSYCKDFKCFNWENSYNKEHFLKIIKNIYPQILKIDDIKVSQTDEAGLVQSIQILSNSRWHEITADKLKSNLNFKSMFFDIIKDQNSIKFKGKGFGHLIGLCQFGLRQMIQEGWSYQDALKFYYPGAKLVRLTKK